MPQEILREFFKFAKGIYNKTVNLRDAVTQEFSNEPKGRVK